LLCKNLLLVLGLLELGNAWLHGAMGQAVW
jgi:hypothetical protein